MENFKPLIKELINFYCEDLGNATGGYFHIVLDDGNIEDGHILACQKDAETHNDTFGIFLGQILSMFTVSEREEMYNKGWK